MKKFIINKNCYWNYNSNKISYFDEEIYLNEKEIKLLGLLLEHPYSTNSYVRLVDKIWDEDFFTKKNDLNLLIISLKKKLPLIPIEEIKGLGYAFKHTLN